MAFLLPPAYRHGIRLADLQLLARSPRSGGEETVDTYYGWREARAMTVAKGMGAAALSLFTAWLVPFLKNEYAGAPTWLIVVAPISLTSGLALFSLVRLLRVDRIHNSYVRAQT